MVATMVLAGVCVVGSSGSGVLGLVGVEARVDVGEEQVDREVPGEYGAVEAGVRWRGERMVRDGEVPGECGAVETGVRGRGERMVRGIWGEVGDAEMGSQVRE